MEDIQDLRKPSDIPPVSLEKLNDYSDRQKDKWIYYRAYTKNYNNVKNSNDFSPEFIYYLQTKPHYNNPQYDQYIGYIIPHSGNMFFLPFYKRRQVLRSSDGIWEAYTTNFVLGDRSQYMFIYYLGINEPADRKRQADEEKRLREEKILAKDKAAEVAETTVRAGVKEEEGYGVEMKTKNPKTGKYDIGGRRTRRRKFRNKKSRKSKKSRKTRKYKRK